MFYLALMISGGLGVLARYMLNRLAFVIQWNWLPFGTMLANIIGCFLIGYLSWFLVHRWRVSQEIQTVILTGFLGGFTTFSAFSLETISLFEQGVTSKALLYVLLSVVCCLLMTMLGVMLARQT